MNNWVRKHIWDTEWIQENWSKPESERLTGKFSTQVWETVKNVNHNN